MKMKLKNELIVWDKYLATDLKICSYPTLILILIFIISLSNILSN